MSKLRIIKPRNYFLLLLFVLNINSISYSLSGNDTSDVEVAYRVILIGDAGEPAKDHPEPVLIALKNEAFLIDSTVVIFLGDNIYPNGLPDKNDKKRREYEIKLDKQINAVEDAGVTTYIISGNHDWATDNDIGWEQIKRQADYI